MQAIMWNFSKFLVGRDGVTVTRHGPGVSPSSMIPRIEELLKKSAPSPAEASTVASSTTASGENASL